jgi:predicted DNA-binding protein (MmcQ/YjbR family)
MVRLMMADNMFALLALPEEIRGITLKCDPELAIELREQHREVTAAHHLNKVIGPLFYTITQYKGRALVTFPA